MRVGVGVVGAGSASARPDTIRVLLAATSTRPGVADAVVAADAAVRRIREALLATGVAPGDVPTAELTVAAEQVWVEGQGSRTTGYTASHALAVTVRVRLGEVLAAALAAGSDDARLDGVRPAVEDESALRARARDAAWADALARGQQLAALAGRRLGPVLAVRELAPPDSAVRLSARQGLAAADLDVQAGDVALMVQLAVRWELA